MNIIQNGNRCHIYGSDVKVYDHLEPKTYDVFFSREEGYSLMIRNDLVNKEDKIYGSVPTKVEKALNGFENSNRNFGVILSGPKGCGKTLFVKTLAEQSEKRGLPVIVVPCYTPGISNFISSIQQAAVVVFDEFEKMFNNENLSGSSDQSELLSLFDGLDAGRKMFVITCNEIRGLSSYFLNRPGRFHYHFMLDVPSGDEIREYLQDKLDQQHWSNIDKVIALSMQGNITYDCLRAIAFDLNLGYSISETLEDLNISKEEDRVYDITITFEDGQKLGRRIKVDFLDDDCCFGISDSIHVSWNCSFDPNDIEYDYQSYRTYIKPENFDMRTGDLGYIENSYPEKLEFYKNKTVARVDLDPVYKRTIVSYT